VASRVQRGRDRLPASDAFPCVADDRLGVAHRLAPIAFVPVKHLSFLSSAGA
jgi:hypothetical protein